MTAFGSGNGPGDRDDAVVIACDAAYHPYASFLAWQLALAQPDRSFDIVIASETPLAAPRVIADLGVRHVTIDAEETLGRLPTDARRSRAAYLWMALPHALDYRRLLAVDADIFHERGDPAPLLRVDMLGGAIAAVRDNKQWRTPGRRVKEFRALGWDAAPYFNSGVVLIDCERYRSDGILARAMTLARDTRGALSFVDQGLINCTLRGEWAELSPVWNWQYTWASSWLVAATDPNLVHFIGRRKPWRDAAGVLPTRYTAPYGRFLEEQFPESERVPHLTKRRSFDASAARRALFRHWRTARSMERYLARFPDSLTVCDPAA